MNLNFNSEDASQVAIGAFALAVPISFSEEAWKLGETLPLINLFLFFLIRIVIAYLIAALVVSLVLIALNKFPLLAEPAIALKRLVVITMPTSMGAIIADSFDKE